MGGCVPGGQKEKIITEIPQRVTIRSKGRMKNNPISKIQNLYQTMPKRLQELKRMHENATKY